jgi:hypothetical protein
LSLGGNYETQRENASNSTRGTRNETLVTPAQTVVPVQLACKEEGEKP